MGGDKRLSLNDTRIILRMSNLTVCLLPLPSLPFSSLKVLLMQESVRRIIEAEESRMGKISNILAPA